MGEGEYAGNWHFLLLPQRFLLLSKKGIVNLVTFSLSSANALNSVMSKYFALNSVMSKYFSFGRALNLLSKCFQLE